MITARYRKSTANLISIGNEILFVYEKNRAQFRVRVFKRKQSWIRYANPRQSE